MSSLIQVSGLCKEFQMGSASIQALKGIDLSIEKNEFVAIMGPSGSGKSTLLHIFGCLQSPTSGKYTLNGKDLSGESDRELSHIRAHRIGFVFQTFNLLPQLNVFENIELPFLYTSNSNRRTRQQILRAIDRVGLTHRVKHKPAELSGGEMQRVAIARALVIEPTLILADEPTGNLDSGTSKEILQLFKELHLNGATIVMVTHDFQVAASAETILMLKDGVVISKTESKIGKSTKDS